MLEAIDEGTTRTWPASWATCSSRSSSTPRSRPRRGGSRSRRHRAAWPRRWCAAIPTSSAARRPRRRARCCATGRRIKQAERRPAARRRRRTVDAGQRVDGLPAVMEAFQIDHQGLPRRLRLAGCRGRSWTSSRRRLAELRARRPGRARRPRSASPRRSATCSSPRSTWRGSSASIPRARSRPRTGSSAGASATSRSGCGKAAAARRTRPSTRWTRCGRKPRPPSGRPTALMTPWIRTTAELAELVASLPGARALALDTESDSLHHHREKVCLIQIASEPGGRLIDPLAGADLSPLAPSSPIPRWSRCSTARTTTSPR